MLETCSLGPEPEGVCESRCLYGLYGKTGPLYMPAKNLKEPVEPVL